MNADPILKLRGETIDEIIQSLDKIIEWAKKDKRRFGYFAALYRKVTIRVKEGIGEKHESIHRSYCFGC